MSNKELENEDVFSGDSTRFSPDVKIGSNDPVLRAPAPDDDDEISEEEFLRMKKSYGSSDDDTESLRKSVRKTSEARTSERRNAEGTVRRTSEKRSDGSERTVRRSADGSVRRSPDGSQVRRTADGSAVRRPADGSVRRNPDGSAVRRNADGSQVRRNPDGSAVRRSADGSAVRKSADGSVRRNPDGSAVRRSADGSQVRRNPDGSAVRRSADGKPVRRSADGSIRRSPDGAPVRKASESRSGNYNPSSKSKAGDNNGKKKLPIFWICLGAWALIIIIAGFCFLRYADKCLVQYENTQSDKVIQGFATQFKEMVMDGSIVNKAEGLSSEENRFEPGLSLGSMYLAQFDGIKTMSYEKDKKSYDALSPVYNIYADDNLVAKMTLAAENERNVFGILKLVDWKIAKIVPALTVETKNYSISVPVGYRITVNGVELTDADKTGNVVENTDFEKLKEYVTLPSTEEYMVKGLINKPDIRIYDATGAEVTYTPDAKGNIYVAYSATKTTEVPSEIADRSLQMVKTWHSFLLRDLGGAYYGLNTVQALFIKDSFYYKMADDYAHGPDITFISDHRLSNPTYTDVVVDNYIKYTDNCYSLHISETTNMVLTRTGEARQDKLDSVFYFVNYDDTDDGEDNPRWCIVDMIATTKTAEEQ